MSNVFKPSDIVESQIPLAIRENNPLFVKFMQYYYMFLEQSKIQDITQDVLQYNDNDKVDLAFLNTYYEEFKGLPHNIAANPRLIAKFIYDLYKSKGTETATKLLFKILYGEEISVSYPSTNILKASVGNWVKDTVLTLNVSNGGMQATTSDIELTSVYGTYKYHIEFIQAIPDTNQLRLFVHLPHDFVISNQTVRLYTGTRLDVTATLVNTPKDITVISGGRDWKVGQIVVFPSTTQSTIARVKKIDSMGAITVLDIVQYGFDGTSDPYVVSPYDDQSNNLHIPPPVPNLATYNASKATLQLSFATQVTGVGYFTSLNGMLSVPSINLEDNFFYQTFSYVIQSQHQIPEFQAPLELIHPAGVKYFAETDKTISITVPVSVTRILG